MSSIKDYQTYQRTDGFMWRERWRARLRTYIATLLLMAVWIGTYCGLWTTFWFLGYVMEIVHAVRHPYTIMVYEFFWVVLWFTVPVAITIPLARRHILDCANVLAVGFTYGWLMLILDAQQTPIVF